jgi:predicted nucleotide-binding protein (sugar kinase/HSP70/actin superfamily)
MYEFNNTKDLSKAVDMYGDYSKQELITMLCYYKDRLNLENKHLEWLDLLADYLRDTSDKEMKQASDESYEEFKSYSRKFNKKWC